MNKIKFLKLFDKVVGKPFVWLLSIRWEDKKEIPEKFKKVLFIRPGGIGDAVLLLPAIHSLRENFPGSHIDILCEKRNVEIFRLSRDINRIYLYDKGFDLLKYIWNSYDVVIDTEQWHRLSAVVAYLTRAAVRIGFITNERGKLFTHQIPYSHDDYEVYSFFHLIEPLIEKPPSFDVNGSFIDTELISPSRSSLLKEIKNNEEYIAIFPGASVPERRWGGEKFGKVAKTLSDKGYKIVIFGSSADQVDAETIKRYADDCIDLTGKTNLRDVAVVLKMSKLLITADSGLMHIAYGVGTPAVSLFGSGIEKKWAPRGDNHIIINKHLECSPCTRFGYTPRCKRNVECLSSISVNEVIRAAEIILNRD
jgi:lipopolysaccharide heptosyltransferase II